MTNGVVVEVVALAVHHVDSGHDHARGAIAALQPMMFAEGLLHGVQGAARFCKPLDGEDVGALHLPGEEGAGLHRLAVHVHYTGTAL